MSTPIIFVGTAPTPTTGADTVSHGPHDAASIDQNMANLRSVLDGKMPLAGSAGQAFTIGALTAASLGDSGAFPPVIANCTATYSVQSGLYQRVGKLCYITIALTVATISDQSATISITGLPYAGKNVAGQYQRIPVFLSGVDWGSSTMVTATVNPNSQALGITGNSSNGAYYDIPTANISAGDIIIISGCYFTE